MTLRFGRKDQDFNLGHERFQIPIRCPCGKAEQIVWSSEDWLEMVT